MENTNQSIGNIDNSPKLYHIKNDRMGGFVPSWDAPKETPKQNIRSFDDVLLSYAPPPEPIELTPISNKDSEFGFLDIIDMINPMQHIPIVNIAYRELTGDEIKPVGKIIGGAIFGGPIGAATSLVNVLIENETGSDVIGSVRAFAGMKNEHSAYKDLPASLLAFAEMPMSLVIEHQDSNNQNNEYKRTMLASGRTVGMIAVYS